MDDIYKDLNNYEDVNTLQELRNENMELKVKLEEHSAAMEKLQKDYDTLEMEFKNLENNYSSLLKTARSEIERKTQRISQLNVEKDMMIINALKEGKNIRRNYNRSVQNQITRNEKHNDGKGNKKIKEDNVKQKYVDVQNERCETTDQHSKDLISDTNNRNKFGNVDAKVELSNSRKSNVKENIIHRKTEHDNTPKTRASSIKDRRKSMPAVSLPIDKFSSDEELEQVLTKDTRTDCRLLDKFEKRNINKYSTDRHSTKTSESSSVEDRSYNYHESISRDTYKSRSSRHHDSSSYKSRDKSDVSLKYRKHYSPERGQKRHHREYQDDYYRQEQGRYQGRSLESPPPESYNRYQRQNPDRRSNYDTHSHDHDKYSYRYEEKYPSKNRFSNDYDEPHTKRQKTELFSNNDTYHKEGRRYGHEKESAKIHTIPEFSQHEYDILRLSCQSPDSVHHTDHTDASFANPVIEIMATAASPLEDPRVTSKRYIFNNENGKEILSTAVGRNIDMKPVNKTEWNLEPVNIPDALVRRPSQCSDELIKDIYMDIENPVTSLNISMESDEVRETADERHEIRNQQKETRHDNEHFKMREQATESLKQKTTNAETVSKTNFAKYKIPKIGLSNKNPHSTMDVPIIDLGESVPVSKNFCDKSVAENDIQRDILTSKQKSDKHDYSHISNKKYSKNENQMSLTKMATVADDLELSDDNSDHVDTNRRVVAEKKQKNCKSQLNIIEAHIDSENNSCIINSHDTGIKKSVDKTEMKIVAEDKTKESDNTKKQKKKKKSKSKEISKDSVEGIDAVQVSEKNTKSKNEQEVILKPKETKEKFCDLFGDSSSLMTPEDLGIPSYLPISKEAQDAVDLKINQIIDTPPLLDKELETLNSVVINNQDTTTHEKNNKDALHKSPTDNKNVIKDTKKKKSSKRKEEVIDAIKLPTPVVYENLNLGTNDPDVVKTVIISTGVQPEVVFENNTELRGTPSTDVEVNTKHITDVNPIPTTLEREGLLKQNVLKALATSTPHKELSAMNSIKADATNAEVSCRSDASEAIAINHNAEHEVKQSNLSNQPSPLDSNDAPDVRIFVKRRRKLVKRPPMT